MESEKLRSEFDPESATALEEDKRWLVGARGEVVKAPTEKRVPDLGEFQRIAYGALHEFASGGLGTVDGAAAARTRGP